VTRPQAATGDRWPALVVGAAARTTTTFLVSLLVWAQIPILIGWTPAVVSSGSMAPRLRTGDVIVYQPRLKPHAGQVVVFRDSARPETLLCHRVQRVLTDGTLITAGDANHSVDSTPVPPANYLGLARLRVPGVGLPVVWWRRDSIVAVIVTIAGIAVVVELARLGKSRLRFRRRPKT